MSLLESGGQSYYSQNGNIPNLLDNTSFSFDAKPPSTSHFPEEETFGMNGKIPKKSVGDQSHMEPFVVKAYIPRPGSGTENFITEGDLIFETTSDFNKISDINMGPRSIVETYSLNNLQALLYSDYIETKKDLEKSLIETNEKIKTSKNDEKEKNEGNVIDIIEKLDEYAENIKNAKDLPVVDAEKITKLFINKYMNKLSTSKEKIFEEKINNYNTIIDNILTYVNNNLDDETIKESIRNISEEVKYYLDTLKYKEQLNYTIDYDYSGLEPNSRLLSLFPRLVRKLYSPLGVVLSATNLSSDTGYNSDLYISRNENGTDLRSVSYVTYGKCQLTNVFSNNIGYEKNQKIYILPTYHEESKDKYSYVELKPIISKSFNNIFESLNKEKKNIKYTNPKTFSIYNYKYYPKFSDLFFIGTINYVIDSLTPLTIPDDTYLKSRGLFIDNPNISFKKKMEISTLSKKDLGILYFHFGMNY